MVLTLPSLVNKKNAKLETITCSCIIKCHDHQMDGLIGTGILIIPFQRSWSDGARRLSACLLGGPVNPGKSREARGSDNTTVRVRVEQEAQSLRGNSHRVYLCWGQGKREFQETGVSSHVETRADEEVRTEDVSEPRPWGCQVGPNADTSSVTQSWSPLPVSVLTDGTSLGRGSLGTL